MIKQISIFNLQLKIKQKIQNFNYKVKQKNIINKNKIYKQNYFKLNQKLKIKIMK